VANGTRPQDRLAPPAVAMLRRSDGGDWRTADLAMEGLESLEEPPGQVQADGV